ncbi:MAG: hypothetical protein IMF11_01345 [Proteobacteria bacterium]|nr:hypothetical protein [Pseudomonadota bacterium]
MLLSLKKIASDCLSLSPPFSVIRDIFGYSASTGTKSLKHQLQLMCLAEVSHPVWSGYWWPMLEGSSPNLYDRGGPLEKYDNYVSQVHNIQPNAVQREKQGYWYNGHWVRKHYTNDPANGWWGHCNGWAAAAVLEQEPTTVNTKCGITFDVGDQKGLLSEAHWYDPVDLILRIGNNAHDYHKILLNWVGNGVAVVMDVYLGDQVWNYPVVKYRMQYKKDATDPNKTHVTCTIWFADDAVPPDFVGLQYYPSTSGKKYYYWLLGDIINPSDGEWENVSVNDHPDLVWHPDYDASGFHGALGDGDTWLREILK